MSFLRQFFIGLTLLYGGCSITFLDNPPSWYAENSMKQNSLIGFGNAKNLDVAKANALSDIIGQLHVQVTSRFMSRTQRKDSQIQYTSSNEVYLDNLEIELNDVRYSQSVFKNGQFYIQAEVSKSALIRQFKRKFDRIYNQIDLKSLSQCNILSIKDKIQLEKKLENLYLYSYLLQSLGGAYQSISKLEKILNDNSPLPTAKLVITSNLENEDIENQIIKELGYFYQIQEQKDIGHTLKAKVDINHTNKYARIKIQFNISDCQDNPLFSTDVSYEANNVKDPLSIASKRASVQLYKKIQEWVENE